MKHTMKMCTYSLTNVKGGWFGQYTIEINNLIYLWNTVDVLMKYKVINVLKFQVGEIKIALHLKCMPCTLENVY